MPALIDLGGQRYGRLLVLGMHGRTRYGGIRWACRCDCGTHAYPFGHSLRRGITVSCGCLQRDRATTHGKSKTPEHTVWQMMLQRCTNPKHRSYPSYGGRGITVCDRWRASFAAFLADVGPRPSDTHKLEREDNDKPYEPGNCRWATPLEQGQNKRNNRRLTHDGLTLTQSEWARRTGIPGGVISKRLRAGYSVAEALTKPRNRGKRR